MPDTVQLSLTDSVITAWHLLPNRVMCGASSTMSAQSKRLDTAGVRSLGLSLGCIRLARVQYQTIWWNCMSFHVQQCHPPQLSCDLVQTSRQWPDNATCSLLQAAGALPILQLWSSVTGFPRLNRETCITQLNTPYSHTHASTLWVRCFATNYVQEQIVIVQKLIYCSEDTLRLQFQ